MWREGRQAAEPEADTEKLNMDDPHGYWMWDEAVKNYCHLDNIVPEVVWKEAGRAAATEPDTSMRDLPVDDTMEESTYVVNQKEYYLFNSGTFEILWKKAAP